LHTYEVTQTRQKSLSSKKRIYARNTEYACKVSRACAGHARHSPDAEDRTHAQSQSPSTQNKTKQSDVRARTIDNKEPSNNNWLRTFHFATGTCAISHIPT
jgi:hypothetical protein